MYERASSAKAWRRTGAAPGQLPSAWRVAAPGSSYLGVLLLLPCLLRSLDAKTFSMADKRTLLDAYNQPALQLERKMLTLHGTWLLSNPRTGQRVAEVKPSLMSLTPCECDTPAAACHKLFWQCHCEPGQGEGGCEQCYLCSATHLHDQLQLVLPTRSRTSCVCNSCTELPEGLRLHLQLSSSRLG